MGDGGVRNGTFDHRATASRDGHVICTGQDRSQHEIQRDHTRVLDWSDIHHRGT